METHHFEATEHKQSKTLKNNAWKDIALKKEKKKETIRLKQTSQKQKLKGDGMMSSKYQGNLSTKNSKLS